MKLASACGPCEPRSRRARASGGGAPRAVRKVPMALCACAVLAMTIGSEAQQPAAPQAPQAAGGRGGGRGGVSPALFTAADTNKDGTLTRSEFKGTLDDWFTKWDASSAGSLTQDQVTAGLTAALQPAALRWGFAPSRIRRRIQTTFRR